MSRRRKPQHSAPLQASAQPAARRRVPVADRLCRTGRVAGVLLVAFALFLAGAHGVVLTDMTANLPQFAHVSR